MFTKGTRPPYVEIGVKLATYADTDFVFTFPKRLSQRAEDEQRKFLLMESGRDPNDYRLQLINMVAEMLYREPEGFDDFPRDERPLAERVREYFDDPEQPELEAMLVVAWGEYRAGSTPTAYIKVETVQ